jgi:hypothetical protein
LDFRHSQFLDKPGLDPKGFQPGIDYQSSHFDPAISMPGRDLGESSSFYWIQAPRRQGYLHETGFSLSVSDFKPSGGSIVLGY